MTSRKITWRTMGDDTSDNIADSLAAAAGSEVASENALVSQTGSGNVSSTSMSTTTMLIIGAAVIGGLFLLSKGAK